MLLRLLPIATPSQPTPPTILFTLPLPNHPYTGRSLPLPPNLLAHRTVCLHEDIECSNVLLGEKSSWITGVSQVKSSQVILSNPCYTCCLAPLISRNIGVVRHTLHAETATARGLRRRFKKLTSQIIDDVTFSLPHEEVRVSYIDGTSSTFAISPACAASLARVVEEVHLSFAPPPPATPRTSISSIASTSSTSSFASASSSHSLPPRTPPQSIRRSTSALLLTLLSPLLPTSSQTSAITSALSAEPAQTSRRHRRQARSLLVDTYSRHVLPELKAVLPPAYLPWAIANEARQRVSEFEVLRVEIDELLIGAGWDEARRSTLSPTSRNRSLSDASNSSDDSALEPSHESEAEFDPTRSPYTPATSAFPSRSSSPKPMTNITPQAYILTIPPAHDLAVSSSIRSKYAAYLARLTRIASRLSAVRRLGVQYDREESKRKWLETLERGKASERGLRRAWSNGLSRESQYAKPITGSRLWRSWTAEEEEQYQASQAARSVIHPAMMDSEEELSERGSNSGSDSESESDSDIDSPAPITPPGTIYTDRVTRQDLSMALTRCAKAAPSDAPSVQVQVSVASVTMCGGDGDRFATGDDGLPELVSSRDHSDESLDDSHAWDRDQCGSLTGDHLEHSGDVLQIHIQPFDDRHAGIVHTSPTDYDDNRSDYENEHDHDQDSSSDEDDAPSTPRHIELLPCKPLPIISTTWSSNPNTKPRLIPLSLPLPADVTEGSSGECAISMPSVRSAVAAAGVGPGSKPKLNPIVTTVRWETEQDEAALQVLDEAIEGHVGF